MGKIYVETVRGSPYFPGDDAAEHRFVSVGEAARVIEGCARPFAAQYKERQHLAASEAAGVDFGGGDAVDPKDGVSNRERKILCALWGRHLKKLNRGSNPVRDVDRLPPRDCGVGEVFDGMLSVITQT